MSGLPAASRGRRSILDTLVALSAIAFARGAITPEAFHDRAAYDLVIRGGRVATTSDVFEADIGITGESIAAVGRQLPAASARSTHAASWFCPAASTATPISNNSRPAAS